MGGGRARVQSGRASCNGLSIVSGDGPIRIVVAVRDGLLLDCLARLFASEPGVEVLAVLRCCSLLPTTCQAQQPEVVVIDSTLLDCRLGRLAALPEPRRLVLITPDSAPELRRYGARLPICHLVSRDAPLPELLAAIERAAAGEAAQVDLPKCIATLSERELDVLGLLAEGLSSRLIADALGVSARTVESHRRRMMIKLRVGSTPELIRTSVHRGLLR